MEEDDKKPHFVFFKSKKEKDEYMANELESPLSPQNEDSKGIGARIGTLFSSIASSGPSKYLSSHKSSKTQPKLSQINPSKKPKDFIDISPKQPTYPREYDLFNSGQFQSESAAPKDTRYMTEGTETTDTMGSVSSYMTNIDFNHDNIQPEEMKENPEFFLGRNTKTPERYMSIRNQIIDMWNESKPTYLSKTQVRAKLKDCGDVNAIGRIHNFLEKVGWINTGPVVGKYIRSKNRIQKKGVASHHSEGVRSSSTSIPFENDQCGSLRISEEPIAFDDSHVIMENSLLLVMDLHCRLINHSCGLLLGSQVTPLLFVVDGIFPLNVGGLQFPSSERVLGIYHSNLDVLPLEFSTYYPYAPFEIIYMAHNTTFHFFNKTKGGLEVKTVEIIKKDVAKLDLERSPWVGMIMNSYIMSRLSD
ncbi:SWIRM domain-containing protein [Entamoeba marina]